MKKHTRQRHNPIGGVGLTNTILLSALFGFAIFGALFTYRNMSKIKGFLVDVKDVNKQLEDVLPKLKSNADKITGLTATAKGYIPKEASAVAKMLKF